MRSNISIVLGRSDALLDERVPRVAVRALPEELGAAVAAAETDVGIEIEDRVARQVFVASDERGRELELRQRLPDRLVQRERVGMVHERFEEQLERLLRPPLRRQMPREGE